MERITPVTGGYLHQTFRADSPAGPFFLKIYRGPDWPLERVRSTTAIQQLLAAAGHPVPPLICPPAPLHGEAGEGVAVLMAYLPGSPATQPNAAQAAVAGVALGRIHRTLAASPADPPHWPDPLAIRTACERLLADVAARERPTACEQRGLRPAPCPPDEWDKLATASARVRLDYLDRHPIEAGALDPARWQWVHGDYYPGNWLFDPAGHLTGVVDYDFASPRFRGAEAGRAVVESALRPDGRFDQVVATAFLRGYWDENPWPAAERPLAFRLWLLHLCSSLYPLPLRYAGAPLPHGWQALAQRRHHLLTWLIAHEQELAHLAARI